MNAVSDLLTVLLTLLALPALAAALYLGLLALLSRVRPSPAPRPEGPRTRFDVWVPAHDEAAGIARTVQALRALDYPEALFRVRVIADNCTDATAARARAAGARVLERFDAQRRGKGYALEAAFAHSLEEGWADAVVVVDADTQTSANLLRAFDARIARGARALQAEYGVLNPGASWRTRLMVLALALFHGVRSLGREALGVSCGLRGNGMCFTRELLRAQPHRAFSLVEDLEYGIQLGLGGERVHFAGEASVWGEMVSSEHASRSQRRRWEGGRLALARRDGPRLLALALARRSGLLLDLALDLLVPPLSLLAGGLVLGTAAAAALVGLGGAAAWVLAPWLLALAALALYVLRGWVLSGTGVRGLGALAWAPVYMVWKVGLLLRRPAHGRGQWVRTAREGEVAR